eukprot:437097-Rhodomonas_salina.2
MALGDTQQRGCRYRTCCIRDHREVRNTSVLGKGEIRNTPVPDMSCRARRVVRHSTLRQYRTCCIGRLGARATVPALPTGE